MQSCRFHFWNCGILCCSLRTIPESVSKPAWAWVEFTSNGLSNAATKNKELIISLKWYAIPGIYARLVFQCLKLLATSYYEFRTGSISYKDFANACSVIDPGLSERRAITDVAAGMAGETYFVLYKGRKRKLERHLAKGSNKDRRYCLRIYFFWDAQDQLSVAFGMRYSQPWRRSLIVSVIPFARLLLIPFSALPDAIGLLKHLIRF